MLPKLIVVTDWAMGERLLTAIRAVCQLGPRIAVLHRHPGSTTRGYFDEARAVAAICRAAGVPLFVHGRLDLALALGAHLHLPADGLAPAEVRAPLRDRWISASVHDEAEARRADGADLVLVSPVFAPSSKPESRPSLGIAGLERIAAAARVPAYALGGISPERVGEVPPRFGLAAIGGVLHAADPLEAATRLLARVGSATLAD